MTNKKCTMCREIKPDTSEFFGVRDAKKGTLRTNCKVCANQYRKKYYVPVKKEDRIVADKKIKQMSDQERHATFNRAYEKLCKKYDMSHDVFVHDYTSIGEVELYDDRKGKYVFSILDIDYNPKNNK